MKWTRNPPKEFQDLLIDNILRFFLHHGLVASFCPRLGYSFHSSLNSSLLHTIRSARHEEECNDDRRAETPERMGCGMERGLRDKHSIFRKLSVLQLYPCGWNNLGCMEVTASLITLNTLHIFTLLLCYLNTIHTLISFPISSRRDRSERRKERVTGTEGNEMGTEAEMDRH